MDLIRFTEVPLVWADEEFTLKLKDGKPHELLFRKSKTKADNTPYWNQKLLSNLTGKCDYFPEQGTDFQQKVWKAIAQIPWGKLKTYSEIAQEIGRPSSVRAVANACGKNPLPLFIPCHRVVAKGGWGGFNGGINLKKKLLRLEGHIV